MHQMHTLENQAVSACLSVLLQLMFAGCLAYDTCQCLPVASAWLIPASTRCGAFVKVPRRTCMKSSVQRSGSDHCNETMTELMDAMVSLRCNSARLDASAPRSRPSCYKRIPFSSQTWLL